MPRLLSGKEVQDALEKLRGWKSENGFIAKSFEFERFMDGIAFVRKVAKVAEKLEHHPDMNIRYTTVQLSVQTHSEGGVTKWDVQLAREIDRLEPAK